MNVARRPNGCERLGTLGGRDDGPMTARRLHGRTELDCYYSSHHSQIRRGAQRPNGGPSSHMCQRRAGRSGRPLMGNMMPFTRLY